MATMEHRQDTGEPRFPCPNCKCYPLEPGNMPIRGCALYCPWCGNIQYFEDEKENNDGKDIYQSGMQQH